MPEVAKPQDDYYQLARRGRGDAIRALRDGRWQATKSQLRRLVLHWPGDNLIDDLRGWYTVELIKASKFESYLTDLVIRHISSLRVKGGQRSHRASTVTELARRGDNQAREALYACFDADDEFRFSREILDLDGFAGLKWLIDRAGDRLNHFEAFFWLHQLNDSLGEATVAGWLTTESASNAKTAEFARLAAEKREPVQSKDEDSLTFEEFLSQPASARQIRPRIWVHRATDTEVEKAWRALEETDDPEWLRRMSAALKRRPAQADIDRLIERAKTWEGDCNPFATSLEEFTDPRVRQLAFDLISSGSTVAGMGLLGKNALPGDETSILAALQTLVDYDDIHSASISVFGMSPGLNLLPHYLWMYEELLCSFCRVRVVEHLITINAAPRDLLEECLLDCESETRKAANEALCRRT